MKRPDNHPSLDSVELYLLNRVNLTAEREVEEHLLVCDQCRSMATAMEHEIDLIQSTLGSLECMQYEPAAAQTAVAG